MTYEEELELFTQKVIREVSESLDKMHVTPSWTPEYQHLKAKFAALRKRQNEEFCKLRAKYHLPPPKVVSSISQKSENDNKEIKYGD